MSDLYNDYYYTNNETMSTLEEGDSRIPTPRKNPKKKPDHKTAKRVGAIALSAVLFGSVAAGAFQGVNYIAGKYAPTASTNGAQSVSASNDTSLIKATSTNSSNSASTGSLDVSSIAENAMPSIVSISNKSVQEVQNFYSMFGYGGQSNEQETESVGSGIIIGKNDSELLIVTNNHVVEGADTLSVTFDDNTVLEANMKGTDAANDLAVIAVPLDKISSDTMSAIKIATLGDSEDLKVGEQVVAIGNALGYGQSVTTGIVSATNRTIDSTGNTSGNSAQTEENTDTNTYIQTDAAINPGNSGGALLNMSGEVVGINSAKLADTAVEGMGYAIPITRVSDLITDLMNQTTRSKVDTDKQGSLGISGIDVSSDIQNAYSIPAGIYVSDVNDGSAADKAGIQAKDIITKFDGKSISSITELKSLLSYYAAGEEVEVTLQRPSGNSYEEKTVTITLDAALSSGNSSSQSPDDSSSQQQGDFFGGMFGGQGSSSPAA